MAPSAVETATKAAESVKEKLAAVASETSLEPELPELLTGHREPLKPTGILEKFEYFDVTPVIGREFKNVDLVEWLEAPNSDELLRELAITISRRGVVYFRAQDSMTNDKQKQLIQRIGELSGKPPTSKLHIHPWNNSDREHGDADPAISLISSEGHRKINHDKLLGYAAKQSQKNQWHSDITFEPVPSDYSVLRMTRLPKTGGDTLWASGYEVYDRISRPLARFLETCTAQYAQPGFRRAAEANGFRLWTSTPRGAPENVGDAMEAHHPVVRTNPVTGWKSLFAVGHHVQRIHGLADDESRGFLDWFMRLVTENHDLQVRVRWQNENDMAIWDNRSVYHAATPDFANDGSMGQRAGARAVSLGERPYFDPESVCRREGLLQEGVMF